MSQKVNKPKENKKTEEQYFLDPFFETLWDQYENSLSISRRRREQRLRGIVDTLDKTTKFNEEYRETLKAFLIDVSNMNNRSIVKRFKNKIEKTNESSDTEMIEQPADGTNRKLEKMMLTPLNSSFDLIDKVEKNLKENSESYIDYVIERSNEWSVVTDNYLNKFRFSHQKINHRMEDRVRLLITQVNNIYRINNQTNS
ncbi:hypothetical protein ACFVR2_09080 [Gottfriedia sp. NPDC057991]|uniref:hypothetical protein n=1 Tax=Gottfriedia sp. NPDC057991 TaxID=3346298 RepID=UPI0036DF8007